MVVSRQRIPVLSFGILFSLLLLQLFYLSLFLFCSILITSVLSLVHFLMNLSVALSLLLSSVCCIGSYAHILFFNLKKILISFSMFAFHDCICSLT